MTAPTTITAPDRSSARPAILVVLGLASIAGALMQTLALPLLPLFPEIFDVSIASAGWIATSTMLVGAISAPLFGWLGDRVGLKPMILLALMMLVVGAIISALAESLAVMVAGRVLQGFSSGIVGLSMALLRRLWHVEGLPIAVGIISGTIGIGTSLGVPVAGLVVQLGSWQAVFWLMALSGGVSCLLVMWIVPNLPPAAKRPFDIAGALGLGVLVTLIFVLLSAVSAGYDDIVVIGAVAAGAIGILLGWLAHERRTKAPFVDLSLISVPAVAISHVIAFLLGFGFFLSFIATITVVQMPAGLGAGLGGSVMLTGLVQLPASLIAIVAPPLAGVMVARVNARAAIATGIGISLFSFVLRGIDLSDPVLIATITMLTSGGISFAFAALPVALMAATPTDRLGASNGFNMLSRQMGAATASVAGAAIVTAYVDFSAPSGPYAFYWLFGLGGLACATALLLSLLTRTLHSHPSSIGNLRDD